MKVSRAEYGDFQTPLALAQGVCRFLASRGVTPETIVEPTCGLGSFVMASLRHFPEATTLGMEINSHYTEQLRAALNIHDIHRRATIQTQDFFDVDWSRSLQSVSQPVLLLGNPPWVTNSDLGTMKSENLPTKSNFKRHAGLDALTGKSNFDISEWMLIRLLEAMDGRNGWLAMLCKLAVARKVLLHAWTHGIHVCRAELHVIDAMASFGAAVDACLLVCDIGAGRSDTCSVHAELGAAPTSSFGCREGQLVADVDAHARWRHLAGASRLTWRSGVKHDCSRVMELKKEPSGYRNGLNEVIALENEYLYPMLKSSDLANGRVHGPQRWMLVPQRMVGQETAEIQRVAPATWRYLVRHQAVLDERRSTIYRNRPRFSVFGVGDYTFAPWKVAISGFYKELKFHVIGTSDGKPIVLDDTSYFLPCRNDAEATFLASLLNSDVAREFYSAYIFWDAKRPITVELLRRLDFMALAMELGRHEEFSRHFPQLVAGAAEQLTLF